MRQRPGNTSILPTARPRLTHAGAEPAPFRWTPAPRDRRRVWLLAVLLGTLALANLGEPSRAAPTEPAPALRHYDPLMSW